MRGVYPEIILMSQNNPVEKHYELLAGCGVPNREQQGEAHGMAGTGGNFSIGCRRHMDGAKTWGRTLVVGGICDSDGGAGAGICRTPVGMGFVCCTGVVGGGGAGESA